MNDTLFRSSVLLCDAVFCSVLLCIAQQQSITFDFGFSFDDIEGETAILVAGYVYE